MSLIDFGERATFHGIRPRTGLKRQRAYADHGKDLPQNVRFSELTLYTYPEGSKMKSLGIDQILRETFNNGRKQILNFYNDGKLLKRFDFNNKNAAELARNFIKNISR